MAFTSLSVATAFAPGPALPVSAGLRLAGNAGPVCFLSEGATRAEPLTIVNGRGDKRTTKGKRFSRSNGKSRPKGDKKSPSCTLPAYNSPWGQPTSGAPPAK